MRVDVQEIPEVELTGMRWAVRHNPSGEMIKEVIWADDELGEYEVLLKDEEGQLYIDPDHPDRPATEVRRGDITIIDQWAATVKGTR